MNASKHRRRPAVLIWLLGVLMPLLVLSGCIEGRVRVRVEIDGSGSRRVELALEESLLEELDLDEDGVRALFELAPERGWTTRRESRPTRGGDAQPHVVFERETRLTSIDEWPSKASDLNLRADLDDPARISDEPVVEVGRGPGFRTVTYRERLDGREIRRLLDRMAARHLVEEIARVRPRMDEVSQAQIRGLVLGHLSHIEIWALEDEAVDVATEQLVQGFAPQLARLLGARDPSAAAIDSTAVMLRDIFEHDDGLNGEIEAELPGLSLLAFTNLKLEVSVPGIIVESNADRIGDGYAAWEGPIWDSINAPREFLVRSHLED